MGTTGCARDITLAGVMQYVSTNIALLFWPERGIVDGRGLFRKTEAKGTGVEGANFSAGG